MQALHQNKYQMICTKYVHFKGIKICHKVLHLDDKKFICSLLGTNFMQNNSFQRKVWAPHILLLHPSLSAYYASGNGSNDDKQILNLPISEQRPWQCLIKSQITWHAKNVLEKNPKHPTLNWHTHTCIHTTTVHKNTIYIIHSNHIWPPPTLHKYMYLLLNEVELSQWQHDEDKDNAESGCQEADVLGNRTITLIIKAEHIQPTQLVRDITSDSNISLAHSPSIQPAVIVLLHDGSSLLGTLTCITAAVSKERKS